MPHWGKFEAALRDIQNEFIDKIKVTLEDLMITKTKGISEGVSSISLSASKPSLADALANARQKAADLNLRLVWDLPVPYSALHPVALELAADNAPQPDGAGKAWLYVEPDGDVLPAQGINKVLGNILTDPWKKIWKQR